jgi:hypothetical protein
VRLPTAIRVAAGAALVAGIVAPLARRRLKLPPPVVTGTAALAPFALCVLVPRSRARDVGTCVLQMWAYVATYEMPNDDPEALQRRVRVRYPVRIDRAIGLGELPGVRLQRAIARVGDIRRADAALVWVHWIWFLVPHSALAYVLARRPDRFARAAALVYSVFDIGVLAYWIVPTAPPWYAARHGEIVSDPALRRMMVEHGELFWKQRWEPLYSLLGGNPLAAMPSLHFATSVMAAIVLWDVGPVEGAVGWTYALTLGFALVYLGEHYVADLLAGLGLTLGVRALARPAAPLALRFCRAVAALEARAQG